MTLTLSDNLPQVLNESQSATHILYRLHEDAWSLDASVLMNRMPTNSLTNLAQALEDFWCWYFTNIGDTDDLAQFQDGREARQAYYEQQIRTGELTGAEAYRCLIQSLCWYVFDESFYGQLDSISNAELRESIIVRRMLRR